MARLNALGYAQKMDDVMSRAAMEAKYPGWHFWINPAGQYVARKLGSLPVVTRHGDDWEDLDNEIQRYLREHRP